MLEEVLDASAESALMEETITSPRQRRILRLIEDARSKGRLRPLRKRLLADAEADMHLLDGVERDFSPLLNSDPKLSVVRMLVAQRVANGQKVLLVSQFADTAFQVYRTLLNSDDVVDHGIGLIMSTAKGGEAPVQVNGRPSTRDDVLRLFAPNAWAQSTVESPASMPTKPSVSEEVAVLVGTDTISVGQNLQDCRTLLHLDLTWNPMMLEQRIGRLDRPQHQADNSPIETRYFLNLDLIETELELKKRIDARLEATYRDTAFDDEILPGYFELIERMRRLRTERGDTSELAQEIDGLIEELSAARPQGLPLSDPDGRRAALDRLRDACAEIHTADPLPPLVVTLGTADGDNFECIAQVALQPSDNNGRPVGSSDQRLLVVGSRTPGAAIDDLTKTVAGVLRPGRLGSAQTSASQSLHILQREVLTLGEALKRERNQLREERKRIRSLIRPAWLGPLALNLRAFVERLPEAQYQAFLDRWGLTDQKLTSWLDHLSAGIDLDDKGLVERVRRLEANPAGLLFEFGAVRDVVPLGLA